MSLLYVVPPPVHATIFFDEDWTVPLICDGFNSAGWHLQSNGFNCADVTVSTDRAFTGTTSLKVVYNNPTAPDGIQLAIPFSTDPNNPTGVATTDLFARM